jgi:putative ABC transport system ATP-binding protein
MAAAASFPRAPTPSAAPPLVELVRVSKEYETGGGVVRAMREVSLSIAEGEFVAIVGTSGSGKSTMMNILGCLDRPTRGTYTLAGLDVGGRAGDSRAIVRNRVIGFIFQGFNLLSRTTALENVELPLQYRGVGARERRRRARAALESVGLGDRLDHGPSQLSGGQQQRVAIARALVTNPPLLLADEPTGNLDTRTSLEVLALLQRLNRERGITIVLVTHERDIAACASRVVTMRDGRIVTDVVQDAPLDAERELANLPSSESSDADGEASRGRTAGDDDAALARASKPVPALLYAVMAAGGLAAMLATYLYLRFGLGSPVGRAPWAVCAAGEIGAAYQGSRWLRRRLGGLPSSDQRVRVAVWFTTVSAAATCALVLAASYVPSLAERPGFADFLDAVAAFAQGGWTHVAPVVVASLVSLALLTYLLLTLFDALTFRPKRRA